MSAPTSSGRSVAACCRLMLLASRSALLVTLVIQVTHAAAQTSTVGVTPIGSIGVEAGNPQQEFGNIEDVGVDEAAGVLLVVDRLNYRLLAFTRAGRFIAQTGRAGAGPGEFRYAGSVAVRNRSVYVLDRGSGRISTFTVAADSFALQETIRLPFQVHDMCMLNGDLFVLGYNQRHLVHRLDSSTGKVDLSFGRPFRDDDPVMAALTSFGIMTCDEPTRSLYVTANSIPTVRRYAHSGRQVWEASVPKVSSTITRTAKGGIMYSPPSDANSEVTVSIVVAPGGRLLVQFGETGQGVKTLQDVVAVTSVLYDISDGGVMNRLTTLPRIDVSSGSYAYSHGNSPFPRVIIYRWR